MRFPVTPRVEYTRNPLAEVICQISFPRQFAIDESLPVELQKQLASAFPFVNTRFNFELSFGNDGEPPAQNRPLVYDFVSADKTVTVSLTSTFVAVACLQYRNWETFSASVQSAWEAVRSTYGLGVITRLGLRYRDVIDRASLGLSDVPWDRLIKRELLGFLASELDGAALAEEARTFHLFRMQSGSLRLNTGLVRSDDDRTSGYLIDSDFILEEQIDGSKNVYMDILRSYNLEAGNLFRWAITDELGTALASPLE